MSDISGVDQQIDLCKGGNNLWSKKAVCVGEDPYSKRDEF